MMKIYTWERSLPNNYCSQTAPGGLEIGASAVIIAPSVKSAKERLQLEIKPNDRFGASTHIRRMVEAIEQTEPTSVIPITTPGRKIGPEIVFLSIGAHYNDPKPQDS